MKISGLFVSIKSDGILKFRARGTARDGPCSRELVVGFDENALDDVDGVDEDGECGKTAEDGEARLLGRVEALMRVHAFLR